MLNKAVFIFIICLPLLNILTIESGGGDFKIAGLPISDPGSEEQWYLEKIKARDAWFKIQGDKNIIVAVIDTGLDLDHPDLRDNLWKNPGEIAENGVDDDSNGYIDDAVGWDFIQNDKSPEPQIDDQYAKTAVNHGTAVSGIIAGIGNNAFAGAGVSWEAKIMPLKVFNENGEGVIKDVIAAVDYAINKGVNIINMSFVGLGYSSSLEAKIKEAYDRGILIVAAAGSESGREHGYSLDEKKTYPICFEGKNGENLVLGVTALDENDKKAEFANFGASCIDISAPGTNISSSLFYKPEHKDFGKYFGGSLNGTSMAAPQVAGAAVLLKALHPDYSNKELTDLLLAAAENVDEVNPLYAGRLGKGRLNVLKAVEMSLASALSEEEKQVKYVLGAGPGAEPKIWLLDSRGEIIKEFFAFAHLFRGGINLALSDLDGDGRLEVVAGAGAGGGPHIRIFDLKGELKHQFFAFDKTNRGGVKVAIGDTDGDGKNEIIAAILDRGAVWGYFFDQNGNFKSKILLYKKIKNNINLAAGDLDADGRAEIVAAPSFGDNEKVKVIKDSQVISEFLPFGRMRDGINLAVGDLNNDGWTEIMVGKERGDAQIKTYDYTGRLLSPGLVAFDRRIGVYISSGDQDSDKKFEIVTAPIKASLTEIKIWDGSLNLKMSFFPFGRDTAKEVTAYIVTRK